MKMGYYTFGASTKYGGFKKSSKKNRNKNIRAGFYENRGDFVDDSPTFGKVARFILQ
jgi:hypothetical protein